MWIPYVLRDTEPLNSIKYLNNVIKSRHLGHLFKQEVPKRYMQFPVWIQWEKGSVWRLIWGETCDFKYKEHSVIQVIKLGLCALTPSERMWCKTNLRDRTSATVLTIPLSRRQGSNTATVFWPAAPLEGSHIFTQTWERMRIGVASTQKPPAYISLKHLFGQTEEANCNYNCLQTSPGSITHSFFFPGST